MLATALSASLFIVAVNRKRLLFYKLLDFCQTTGTYVFLNIAYPHSITKIM